MQTHETIIYPFAKWVKAAQLESINGYSPDAIRGKIRNGHWKQGREWKKAPDGNIMVNPRAIDEWIETHDYVA